MALASLALLKKHQERVPPILLNYEFFLRIILDTTINYCTHCPCACKGKGNGTLVLTKNCDYCQAFIQLDLQRHFVKKIDLRGKKHNQISDKILKNSVRVYLKPCTCYFEEHNMDVYLSKHISRHSFKSNLQWNLQRIVIQGKKKARPNF